MEEIKKLQFGFQEGSPEAMNLFQAGELSLEIAEDHFCRLLDDGSFIQPDKVDDMILPGGKLEFDNFHYGVKDVGEGCWIKIQEDRICEESLQEN